MNRLSKNKYRIARIATVTFFAVGCLVVLLTWWQVQPWSEKPLPNADKSLSLRVLDRYGELIYLQHPEQNNKSDFNFIDQAELHDVPEVLLQAIVAAEDKRFWRHQGADWLARMRAAWSNLINFKVVRGASTISEQVVRMLRPRPRTIWNRWLEGWEARLLEKQLDKASILEFYINQIPFTSNKRGVSQAADYYFDRDLSTLNHKEALALAVFIRAPSILHPDKNPKLVERRIEILANRMYEEGRLNDSEFR
ncbi:MAG: transglycosylase domain-containing protein, partial [Kangiellaceae bacterium]|nr:transglycosylase domain-containing protein [Kangiellaceae bacterium]